MIAALSAAVATVAAGVLILAGVAKLREPAAAVRAWRALRLPPSAILVRLFASVELCIGGYWLAHPSLTAGLLLTGAYVALASAVAYALASGRATSVPCGCLGGEDTLLSSTHLVFNAASAVAAATITALATGTYEPLSDLSAIQVAEYLFLVATATYLAYLVLGRLDSVLRVYRGGTAESSLDRA